MEESSITPLSLSKVILAKMEEGFTGGKEECGEPSKLLYWDPQKGEESLDQQWGGRDGDWVVRRTEDRNYC